MRSDACNAPDPRFVALLLDKAHYQGVYSNELEEAWSTLDALQATLGEPATTGR